MRASAAASTPNRAIWLAEDVDTHRPNAQRFDSFPEGVVHIGNALMTRPKRTQRPHL